MRNHDGIINVRYKCKLRDMGHINQSFIRSQYNIVLPQGFHFNPMPSRNNILLRLPFKLKKTIVFRVPVNYLPIKQQPDFYKGIGFQYKQF